MDCKYIYGIIDGTERKTIDSYGLNNIETVYTFPYMDVSAVLSDTGFIDFKATPKDYAVKHLLRHQEILEGLMDSYAVVPVKLGTYAFSTGEVEEILSKGYMTFKDVLGKVHGRIEIDVAITLNDLNEAIREVANTKLIKGLKDELMSKPEGISEKDQIMVGRLVKNLLGIEREKLSVEILSTLRGVSIDSISHELMDDRMILNTAFLIDKDKKDEFERTLNKLDRGYNGKLNFRCVGPLPTYSFYTAEIKRISFTEMEKAKKLLRLGDIVTEDELKKAYRRLAMLYHPDRKQGRADFNEINNAYKLLLEYTTEKSPIIVKVGYGR